MTEINIIPEPTYQKVEPGKTNLLSIKKIITKTNNISEIEIAKMVQQLINPINNIEIETSQSKESNAISILLITIYAAKNHDDFPYYHFPYTHLLTEYSVLIGIGNFNHGFRTHSSIFYLFSKESEHLVYSTCAHHVWRICAIIRIASFVSLWMKN